MPWGEGQEGGGKGKTTRWGWALWVEAWRQGLPQGLGEEGILIPSRQVWGWRHADLWITRTPGEKEMITVANLAVFLTLQFCFP